jgi:hypothetical protein
VPIQTDNKKIYDDERPLGDSISKDTQPQNKPEEDSLGANKNQVDSDIAQKENNSTNPASEKPDTIGTEEGFFKGGLELTSPKISAKFWNNFANNRKAWLGAAGLGSLIFLIIGGGFLGFLNVFKLEHFMQNVEQKAMVRYIAASDKRSSKWAEAYVQIRLTELKGEDTPGLFRSDRVDTNSPMSDWYKTMRASNFEKDLAKKGIVFTNFVDGKTRGFAILEVDGKKVAGLDKPDMKMSELIDELNTKGALNGVTDFDLDKPGANSEIRKVIKKAVNDNTHSWNVIKRRQLRKSVQNMTGIKDWRFFETTRDKYDSKKLAAKQKLVSKVLPESTKSGKLIGCLLGYSDCSKGTKDPADPANKVSGDLDAPDNDKARETDVVDDTTQDDPNTPENEQKNVSGETDTLVKDALNSPDIANEALGKTIKQMLSKANPAVSIVSIIDSLVRVNDNIKEGSLTKMIYVAKLTQLMGVYQVIGTSQDQLKTGQVNSQEVNDTMNYLNNLGNNDGWSEVIGKKSTTQTAKADGDTPAPPSATKEEYCSIENQTYINDPANAKENQNKSAYVCDAYKPNGGDTKAKTIEDTWNKYMGPVLNPISEIYNAIGLKTVMGWIDGATSWLLNPLMDGALSALGVKDNIEDLMSEAMARATEFLGGAPLVNGGTSGPQFGMFALGGGAGSQSVAMRDAGAITTNTSTAQSMNSVVAEYNANKNNTSLYDKYISLDNEKSIGSTVTYNLASTATSGINLNESLAKIVKNTGNIITMPFSGTTKAETDNYAADNHYGVDSYDFPDKCLNRDVIDSYKSPKNATNIQEILGENSVPDSELSWTTLRNSEEWYTYLYSKNPTDEQATQIYNCELLDNQARGGVGFVYGWTDDNGLDAKSENGDPSEPGSCPKPPQGKEWSEAHLQPNSILIGRCTFAMWPEVKVIGGWRPSDPYPDHPSGRAVDIMMPGGCKEGSPDTQGKPEDTALGKEIADYFSKNAKDYGVDYIIWDQQIWNPVVTKQWRDMSDRGGCTANHRDHVHITVKYGKAPAWFKNSDTTVDTKKIHEDSSNIPCADGTDSVGVEDGYYDGKKVRIRLCSIPKFPCSNEECNGGFGVNGDGHALVNSRVSGAMLELINAARKDGMNLSTISSFRTMAHQQQLWNANPNPELVAPPGHSNHQMGIAIDFEGTNVKGCSGRCKDPGSPVWRWLDNNAKKYGFTQYDNESWHWSVGGS